MNNEDQQDFLRALDVILSSVKDDFIGLPEDDLTSQEESIRAYEVMREVEAYIGEAASSDYYSTSRDRFAKMLACAHRHLPPGARVLDIGNAPGFLAYAFHKSKFKVSGLNLSDEWIRTYPNAEMVALFDVKACDIESSALPFEDDTFEAILFTEVLEHIAIKRPKDILPEFRRVLKPGGVVLFSTPNVCNLSNIIALMTGKNIFWPVEIFFGSTDRHNREFSPKEVFSLFEEAGFSVLEFFGVNDHANWRTGTQDLIYPYLASRAKGHPLLRNTIMAVFSAP